MATLVCIFFLMICSFVYCDATPYNGQRTSFGRCREEEERLRGNFIFRCKSGNLVPSACVMQDGNRIPIGSTSVQNSFVKACQQGSGNTIGTKIIACVNDMGQQVQANSVFQWHGGPHRCIVNPSGDAEIQPAWSN